MMACDSHVHLFGPLARYPVRGPSPYVVPDATAEQLLALMRAHDIGHAVLVHAAVSGRDNRLTLDALRAYPIHFRGILVPPLEAPDDATLQAWHALGVRGMRFSLTHTAQPGMGLDVRLAARMAELGWHAQVHVEGDQIVRHEADLAALPGRVVVDHMARIPAGEGVEGAGFAALRRLVDSGRIWVKLSAPMRLSACTAPPYADVAPIARALVRQIPERLVWGSDWPNVNLARPAPAYGALLRELDDWTPTAVERRRILHDNPALLYDLPVDPDGGSDPRNPSSAG
jgi:2-pyrone-4,6-dicarboxylate lactonase